mmetsp:Transcript_8477/g.19359  ORF Transcript_8477/g.19359 Transcript_8477/m.19359 type:complete len:272 (-) Transcript_8477:19-834(-)
MQSSPGCSHRAVAGFSPVRVRRGTPVDCGTLFARDFPRSRMPSCAHLRQKLVERHTHLVGRGNRIMGRRICCANQNTRHAAASVDVDVRIAREDDIQDILEIMDGGEEDKREAAATDEQQPRNDNDNNNNNNNNQALWSEQTLHEEVLSTVEWNRNHHANCKHHRVTLVATNARQVVGFVCASVVANEAQILNLCVSPAHRRRGVATALMKTLSSKKEKKWGTVYESVLEVASKNKGAHALYERLGFDEVGRRRKYYKNNDDAIIMKCTYF